MGDFNNLSFFPFKNYIRIYLIYFLPQFQLLMLSEAELKDINTFLPFLSSFL